MGLVAFLGAALSMFALPAMAQKGGGGGGTGGGGTGGGGGGGGITLATLQVQMVNNNVLFNTLLPQGVATFAASKDGTTKNLDLIISDIDLPDGSVVNVESMEAIRVTGRCWHYEPYYYTMTIQGHQGTLSFHSDRGDFVPFLDQNKGWTRISIMGQGVTFLTAVLPFKGKL